jgi:hypothetical protein
MLIAKERGTQKYGAQAIRITADGQSTFKLQPGS